MAVVADYEVLHWLNEYSGAGQVVLAAIALLLALFNLLYARLTRRIADATDEMLRTTIRQYKDSSLPVIVLSILSPSETPNNAAWFTVNLNNVGTGPAIDIKLRGQLAALDVRFHSIATPDPDFRDTSAFALAPSSSTSLACKTDIDHRTWQSSDVVGEIRAEYFDIYRRRISSVLIVQTKQVTRGPFEYTTLIPLGQTIAWPN